MWCLKPKQKKNVQRGSLPTSNDPWPLFGFGLDLWKPPSEVTGVKHVDWQRGDAVQDYPILAVALVLKLLDDALRLAITVIKWNTFSSETGSAPYILCRHVSTIDSTSRRSLTHSQKSILKRKSTSELANRPYMVQQEENNTKVNKAKLLKVNYIKREFRL